MNDREKVISEFERCIGSFSPADTSDEYFICVCKRALELLKEQEPQNVVVKCEPSNGNILWFANCPKCGKGIERDKHKNHCGYCGQAVKWK